jgi:CPA2 family monovalent cation:H+ antiporter-2
MIARGKGNSERHGRMNGLFELYSLPAAAAAEDVSFLREMVAVFAVSAVLAYICFRLRLVPIVGFLIAGVLIGPHALGLVRDQELIASTAEVGVILLLFTLGVEFSLDKLARIKRYILVGGGLQVGLTMGLAAVILLVLGVGWRAAVYSGCLVALSSTAVVVKLLSDRGATDTPAGRISLGILIFQDLFIIPVVLIIPLLGAGEGSTWRIVLAVLESSAIIAAVLIAARRVVPSLLDRVAQVRSPELFLLTVVVICFGIAWLASLGGVSLALGAFLAGLVVSGSRFREHAVGEIIPLRTIFNAVFFVSIGMLLDLRFVIAHPLLILAAAGTVLVLKATVTGASVLLLRYPAVVAVGVGLALAQIGEFSLVLHRVGSEAGLSPAGLGVMGDQAFLAVAVVLMTLTPILLQVEPKLRNAVHGRGRSQIGLEGDPDATAEGLAGHVVVGGYGLAGHYVRTVLETFDIPSVVVELNPVTVAEAKSLGVPAVYGDLSHAHVLRQAGIVRARVVVIAINDPEAVGRIVQRIRMLNSTVAVIVRSPYIIDFDLLNKAGADVVVTEELEAAAKLVDETLRACDVPPEEAERQVKRLRAELERS